MSAEAAVQSRDWSVIVLAGLLGARFFLPEESSANGETLWLVVLTLFYCALQHILRWRNGEGPRRLDRIDAAMITLVLAHVISSAVVVLGEGQKRAAINVAWEWLSSLLLWFEFRKRFENGHGSTLIRTVLSLAVVLGAYGIWQNQVEFKYNAGIVNEWETLHQKETPLSREEATQLRKIEEYLGPDFRSATGGTRRMLIDRARSSTEPMGCFGLANSFAGLLAVGLWLGMAVGVSLKRRPLTHDPTFVPGLIQKWGPQVCSWSIYGVLLICLVMTKSRTAYIGIVAAGVLLAFVTRTGKWYRQGTIAAITVALVAMALVSLALMTGLIDQQVISEAPKSLKYRLEYWAATSRLIVDHVWLGCGPGNFRPNYLHYKLPGASEEILDPHNMLLDVWANAGVVAWAGLLALLIWGVRTGWRAVVAETSPNAAERRLPLLRWSEGVQAALAGPALIIFEQVAFRDQAEGRMWFFVLAAPFVGGWVTSLSGGLKQAPIWAAWIALSIHLCGAGGIAMPAIFQVWSLLLACLVTTPSQLHAEPVEGDEIVPASAMALPVSLGVALGCLALAIACVRSTLLPNSLCLAKMAEAMQTSSASGRNERVAQQLIAAAEIDPLNPDPWVLLMQLRAKPETGEIANAALKAGQEAIQRNPENPMTYELLGDLYAAVEPPSDESRAEAVKWYREAAKRYPNSAKIRTSLAIALSEGGHKEDAAKEATQSLQLDRLNQAAGHADKILTSERREMLERIAKKESKLP